VITQVESDNAYRAGVRRGQLIMMINNRDVGGMDDFRDIVAGLEPGRNVALLVRRQNGQTAFLAYEPETAAAD
jgi:serine protease Do